MNFVMCDERSQFINPIMKTSTFNLMIKNGMCTYPHGARQHNSYPSFRSIDIDNEIHSIYYYPKHDYYVYFIDIFENYCLVIPENDNNN